MIHFQNKNLPIFVLAILTFVLAFNSNSAKAGEGLDWRTDYRKAYQEAQKTGKPMLLKFTAPWCVFCHKMEKSFAEKTVAEQVNKNFIPIMVNADTEKELSEALKVKGLPTTVILTTELEVAGQIKGFLPPEKLTQSLDKIIQKVNGDLQIEQTSLKKEVKDQKTEEGEHDFDGVCLVELQARKKVVEGDEKYFLNYHGYKLVFSSEENKDEFKKNPEKYWPALNGYCPVAAAGGLEAKGNVRLAAFYKNKIWLFSSQDNRSRFATNPRIYIKALDKKDLID